MDSPKKNKKTGLKGKTIRIPKKLDPTASFIAVRLISGENLLASDVETGKSDPVGFIWVGLPLNEKPLNFDNFADLNSGIKMTETCKTTLNPIWKGCELKSKGTTLAKYESLTRDSNDLDHMIFPIDISDLDILFTHQCIIQIRDEDTDENGLLFYQDLGMVEISISNIISEGKPLKNAITFGPKTIKLDKVKGMRRVDGNIKVKLSLVLSENDAINIPGKDISEKVKYLQQYKPYQEDLNAIDFNLNSHVIIPVEIENIDEEVLPPHKNDNISQVIPNNKLSIDKKTISPNILPIRNSKPQALAQAQLSRPKSGLRSRSASPNHYSNVRKVELPIYSHINVRLMSGESLLASDIETGKSDPIGFVWIGPSNVVPNFDGFMEVGSGIKATEVCYGTINPIWSEGDGFGMVFPVCNSTVSSSTVSKSTVGSSKDMVTNIDELVDMQCVIRIRDEDKDTITGVISYRDLGEVSIPLTDIIQTGKAMKNTISLGPKKYKLNSTKDMGKKMDGSVRLKVSLVLVSDDLRPWHPISFLALPARELGDKLKQYLEMKGKEDSELDVLNEDNPDEDNGEGLDYFDDLVPDFTKDKVMDDKVIEEGLEFQFQDPPTSGDESENPLKDIDSPALSSMKTPEKNVVEQQPEVDHPSPSAEKKGSPSKAPVPIVDVMLDRSGKKASSGDLFETARDDEMINSSGSAASAARLLKEMTQQRNILQQHLDELTKSTRIGLKSLSNRVNHIEQKADTALMATTKALTMTQELRGLHNPLLPSTVEITPDNPDNTENASAVALPSNALRKTDARGMKKEVVSRFKEFRKNMKDKASTGGTGVVELVMKGADGVVRTSTSKGIVDVSTVIVARGDDNDLNNDDNTVEDEGEAELEVVRKDYSKQRGEGPEEQRNVKPKKQERKFSQKSDISESREFVSDRKHKQYSTQEGYSTQGRYSTQDGGGGGVDWRQVEGWMAEGDYKSCFIAVLDRGDMQDLSRLMELTGPRPELLSVTVRSRVYDCISIMLMNGQGRGNSNEVERCLVWVLALVRGNSSNVGGMVTMRTVMDLVEALEVAGREPSRRGLLASLLSSQLGKGINRRDHRTNS